MTIQRPTPEEIATMRRLLAAPTMTAERRDDPLPPEWHRVKMWLKDGVIPAERPRP